MSQSFSDNGVFKIKIVNESAKDGLPERYTIIPENFELPLAVDDKKGKKQNSMSYVKCAVPLCNNYFDGQRQEFMGISYFAFPEDEVLKEVWLREIGLPQNTAAQFLKVCSVHFCDTDFNLDTGHMSLKPNVLPKKFLREGESTKASPTSKVALLRKCVRLKENDHLGNTVINPNSTDSTKIIPVEGGTEDAMPVITSIMTLTSDKIPTILETTRLNCSRPSARTPQPTKYLNPNVTNEKGLIIVPASLRLPTKIPKKAVNVGELIPEKGISRSSTPTIDLDSSDSEKSQESPTLNYVPAKGTLENPKLNTSSINNSKNHLPAVTTVRKRWLTKAEKLRMEEEDEWQPPENFDRSELADISRRRVPRRNELKKHDVPSKYNYDSEDDGDRVGEPKATGEDSQDSDEDDNHDPSHPLSLLEVSMDDAESNDENSKSHGPARRNGSTSGDSNFNSADEQVVNIVTSDVSSILMEWYFFKSLIPDLGKLNDEQRIEVKTFMLDKLNDIIYSGRATI